MAMIIAHKIRLNPTVEQEAYFVQACNASRVVWNWALAQWKASLLAGEKPTAIKLKKQFNSIKREQFAWVCQVTKSAAEQAFIDLGQAFSNFFKNPSHFGYPKFKKKGKSKESFYLANDQFKIDGHRIRIPKLDKYTGVKKLWWVNMSEKVRFQGRIMGARVSRVANFWYIAISVEVPEPVSLHPCVGSAVGVDLGIKQLATLSTGEVYANIQAMRQNQKRLVGLSRQLAKREKGSKRWQVTKQKIQRTHQKIANQRQDHIHKMTHYLTSNYEFIALEDLNVTGMLNNHKLAKSISDASFGEIVRQIEYKAKRFNGKVQKVNRWFPSSKICSCCGTKNAKLMLSERTYNCINPKCGLSIDRDLNAALNILREGLRI